MRKNIVFIVCVNILSLSLTKVSCGLCQRWGIIMSCSSIVQIPEYSHGSMIDTLEIKNSNIPNLFSSSINIPSLTKLHVKNTSFDSIKSNAFDLLKNLNTLDVTYSNVTEIAGTTFLKNSKLSYLDISNNCISFIPNILFFNRTELYKIVLRKNNIKFILRSTFVNNYKLHALDLSENRIHTIEHNAFNMTQSNKYSKTVVNISHNELKDLRRMAFSQCCGVTILDLSHNNIVYTNNDTFNGLPSLRELYLGNNQITVLLSSVLRPLNALRKLDLQNNKIRNLFEDQFAGVNSLTWLRLSNNEIDSIEPHAFRGLLSLEELFLDGNNLVEIKNICLSPLPSLEMLDVSGNKVALLHKCAFSGCPALTKIDLSENSVLSIEDCAFAVNSFLKDLNFGGNFPTTLSCDSFFGLSSLKSFTVEGSVFNTFYRILFHGLVNVNQLNLKVEGDSECNCEAIFELRDKSVVIHLNDDKVCAHCSQSGRHLPLSAGIKDTCKTIMISSMCETQVCQPPVVKTVSPVVHHPSKSPIYNCGNTTALPSSSSHINLLSWPSRSMGVQPLSFSKIMQTEHSEHQLPKFGVQRFLLGDTPKSSDSNIESITTEIISTPVQNTSEDIDFLLIRNFSSTSTSASIPSENTNVHNEHILRAVIYFLTFVSVLIFLGTVLLISCKLRRTIHLKNHVYEEIPLREV